MQRKSEELYNKTFRGRECTIRGEKRRLSYFRLYECISVLHLISSREVGSEQKNVRYHDGS